MYSDLERQTLEVVFKSTNGFPPKETVETTAKTLSLTESQVKLSILINFVYLWVYKKQYCLHHQRTILL